MRFNAFRFLHASDLHLDAPFEGLSNIPEALTERLIDAPYQAATLLFERALADEVEFVLLSGDILNASRSGPRGPLFLAEQFRKLDEAGIRVYWATGRNEHLEDWSASIHLPESTVLFTNPQVQAIVHRRAEDGASLACIEAVARQPGHQLRTSDFQPNRAGLFTIAMLHGMAGSSAFAGRGVHYWALGGSHQPRTLFEEPTEVAYWPGSPQSRRFSEPGPHGSAVVTVSEQGETRIFPFLTDQVRHICARVELDTESATPDVKKILVQRMQELREEHHEINTLLVEWTIVAHPEQIIQFQREGQEQAWLTSLREQFGEGERLAWSASLQFEPAGTLPPQWREDDTLRGDFLAMMHAVETGEVALSLDAEDFPLDQNDTDEIQQMLGGFTSQEIMELNLEIALRGVDLLSGQEGVEAKS